MKSVYLQGIEAGREIGRAEGLAEGQIKGKIDSIFYILSRFGPISESLRKQISEQTDHDILNAWLEQAVSAKSMEEFEAAITRQ